MDIRCTTKPGNGWFEIRTENTTDFAPNGGGLVREIGFSYFREIRWLVKYYSIWVDGLFLFCIHSCWKCCIFVIWKHMSNKQKVGQRLPGQSLQESRCWPWQIQYVNWYIGSWVWKVPRIPCLSWKLRILYTLSFNCFGIGATGVSLLFEFCHMNFYIFRMHYHSKLDIQTIINTSSEHTSSITTSPKKRISLMYCLGTGWGLFPAYVG